jgi:hypothetical protein
VEALGFEHLKEMYKEDPNFNKAYEAYENPLMRDRIQWMEYLEGCCSKEINYLFQNVQ